MHIIVGLGNPGAEYEKTRHNFGFMVVDYLADLWKASFKKGRKALEASCLYNNDKVILLKPQTFMNLSGEAISSALAFYKPPLTSLLIAHDELDLELGTIKFSTGGSSGGHNGIASIIEQLGTKDFNRLRLGISRPKNQQPVVDYVLKPFLKEDSNVVDEVIKRSTEGILSFLKDGMAKTMNQYNKRSL